MKGCAPPSQIGHHGVQRLGQVAGFLVAFLVRHDDG
jgi:hypothetical protein